MAVKYTLNELKIVWDLWNSGKSVKEISEVLRSVGLTYAVEERIKDIIYCWRKLTTEGEEACKLLAAYSKNFITLSKELMYEKFTP